MAGFNETSVTPVVTMPTPIMGTANSPDFLQYTLQYSVEGQNQWTTFASGTTAVINGTLGTIDPTMMENGFYDVRLTVEDTSGQVTTADEVYQVDGQAKIGNFTLSFQDVNIPTPGFPITVTRTYDSRDKDTQGDFGYGWSLSMTQRPGRDVVGARARASSRPRRSCPPRRSIRWEALAGLAASAGFGGLPGHRPAAGPGKPAGRDPVQLPEHAERLRDDLPARWDAENVPHGLHRGDLQLRGPAAGDDEHLLRAAARNGHHGNARRPDQQQRDRLARAGRAGDVHRPSTGQVYNPTRWKYTDQSTERSSSSTTANGLESVTDANGNTVTFSRRRETTASDGRDSRSLATRRAASRRSPTRWADVIKYGYDFYGDLVTVTDPAGNVTRFTYDTDHTLLDGLTIPWAGKARNEYDDSGRLIATVDAEGYRVTYDHDIDTRQEITKDRNGNTTVTTYGESGQILSVTDALGNTTHYTYSPNGEIVTSTDALGETTTTNYDANGNKVSETDPAGYTTRWTYNAMNEALTTTDPMGNVTTNAYERAREHALNDRRPGTHDKFRLQFARRDDLESRTRLDIQRPTATTSSETCCRKPTRWGTWPGTPMI